MSTKAYILGEHTNGHLAANILCSNFNHELVFCGTHENIFNELRLNSGFAVVPVRNNIVGEIKEIADEISSLLKKSPDAKVLAEHNLKVSHCLAAKKGGGEVTAVVSHPKALAQCSNSLDELNIHNDSRQPCSSTARAAEIVANRSSEGLAAITTKSAAEFYGLDIVNEDLSDDPDNYTTFALVRIV